MKTILVTAVLTFIICSFNLGWGYIYTLAGLGLLLTSILLLSIRVMLTPSKTDSKIMSVLCTKLRKDKNLRQSTGEILSLVVLQVLNLLFLREYLILVFFGLGGIFLAAKLTNYLEENYYDDFERAFEKDK